MDIRYLHVRKVTVDASIEEGLPRGIVVVPTKARSGEAEVLWRHGDVPDME